MSPPEADTESLAGKSIPSDIIIGILSKLPVKSVTRFQTLSKFYKDAISDSWFSKENFIHRSKSDDLFLHMMDGKGLFNLLRLEGENFKIEADLGAPFGANTIHLSSCNGIVLVLPMEKKARDFALWNPSIRKHTRVAIPDAVADSWVSYGLYHDPETDDYKVVIISVKNHLVFSCKSRSWVEGGVIPCSESHGSVVVDGCFYWTEDGEIRRFDLRRRETEILKRPDDLGGKLRLAVLWGRLCLRTKLGIWVWENCRWQEVAKMGKRGVLLWHTRQHVLFRSEDMSGHFRYNSGFLVFNDCDKRFEERHERICGVESMDLVPCSESLFFPFQAKEDVNTERSLIFPKI